MHSMAHQIVTHFDYRHVFSREVCRDPPRIISDLERIQLVHCGLEDEELNFIETYQQWLDRTVLWLQVKLPLMF